MKKITTTLTAGIVLGLSALSAKAQEDIPPTPSWVSEKGYWVVETRRDSSIVYYYNNDNLLIHQERQKGSLKADRRKTKLRLTRTLEQTVIAFSRRNGYIYRQMMNGEAIHAGQP